MKRLNFSRKKIKIFVFSTLGILLLGVVLGLVFRNAILEQVIAKAAVKMQNEYQCQLVVKNPHFEGLNHIEMEAISVKPFKADTLLYIGHLRTGFSFWKLLTGTVQITDLEVNRGYIQLVKTKNGSNFDAFLRKKEKQKDTSTLDYAEVANRLTSRFLNLIPTQMNVTGFALKINDKGHKVHVDFTQLALKNEQLTTAIQLTEGDIQQQWQLSGFADPRNRKADLVFKNPKNDTVVLPYLQHKFRLKTAFRSAAFHLDNLGMDSGDFHTDGYASIQQLVLNHPKIASKDVEVANARMDFHWIIGERSIALDSSSLLTLGKLKCRPYLFYEKAESKTYALQLHIPKTKAQDFIDALPKGLFSHFEGMKTMGSFSYSLNFKYNDQKPNEVVFENKLEPEGLKIVLYGAADLSKINTEFVYRAMERGVPQRPILVSIDNPMYTPLSEISPYLQKCVLTSEDPSFMHHRGFISEAFKQSIAKNIRTKKFARGASTISMQLVKNVFLTREKTLSRKLEEILLVYILENQRIATKERMLEVYFNIIEWGPDVYGIGEAAAYYFQKRPSELTLKECLYLATIIPKPKGFMYRFDGDRSQKKFALQQQDFLTKLMLRRQLITAEDTLGYHEPLRLTGPALSRIKGNKVDSLAIDSLQIEFPEF
ncbi:MAG: Monofunctional biosynthetic peptidoglycan transglycosylase [Bacteroidota bacterium]|jgi:hypothetical protein